MEPTKKKLSLRRRCARSARFGQHSAGRQIHRSHLAGHWRGQAKLTPRDDVDASRRAQTRYFQFEFLIEFRGLGTLAAQRFELVAELDRLEMLPGIQECTQADHSAQQNQARTFA